jgi:anti-sigma regulatory factor (Ser/Thr protein kinase)
MCWQADRVYFCDWTAPRTARGFCTDHLTSALGHGADAQPVIDDTVAVVSELVSNAVQAGCSTTEVMVALHRDHIRVTVSDNGAGEPELQHPSAEEEHGRGLHVVAHLASSWGVTHLGDEKQVWAVLAVPAPLTEMIDCAVPTRVL